MLQLDTTYEELVEEKLDQADSSLDTREGSILFNAFAINSIEIIQMLQTIIANSNEAFADTASRSNLIKRAAERGLKPLVATKARLRGIFNINVDIGARFSLDNLNYVVIDKIADLEFVLECETVGDIGNQYLGTLIPIDYIDGLTTAELVEVLVPGEDEEDTEVFRARYFDSFDSEAFGGNRKDYKDKVNSLPGVGGVRVYRAWNGGGTVKLVIINSQFEKPTQTLVDDVQFAVDPLEAQGEGIGIAPIDHIVSVFGVGDTPIDISLNITYQSGWTWPDIEANVHAVIDEYFRELAEEWAKASTYDEDHAGLIVRISQIEIRLLGVAGVIDIADTLLNGGTSNVAIDKESIPKRGVVIG